MREMAPAGVRESGQLPYFLILFLVKLFARYGATLVIKDYPDR